MFLFSFSGERNKTLWPDCGWPFPRGWHSCHPVLPLASAVPITEVLCLFSPRWAGRRIEGTGMWGSGGCGAGGRSGWVWGGSGAGRLCSGRGGNEATAAVPVAQTAPRRAAPPRASPARRGEWGKGEGMETTPGRTATPARTRSGDSGPQQPRPNSALPVRPGGARPRVPISGN